jgi:hypothetical protein
VKHFYLTCTLCGDTWVSGFISEHGLLVAVDETGESCTDCGGDVEIGDEYERGDDREYEREEHFDF